MKPFENIRVDKRSAIPGYRFLRESEAIEGYNFFLLEAEIEALLNEDAGGDESALASLRLDLDNDPWTYIEIASDISPGDMEKELITIHGSAQNVINSKSLTPLEPLEDAPLILPEAPPMQNAVMDQWGPHELNGPRLETKMPIPELDPDPEDASVPEPVVEMPETPPEPTPQFVPISHPGIQAVPEDRKEIQEIERDTNTHSDQLSDVDFYETLGLFRAYPADKFVKTVIDALVEMRSSDPGSVEVFLNKIK